MPQYPKHPSLLARRNKVTTATELTLVEPGEVIEVPPPPQHYLERDGDRVPVNWHPNAMNTWAEIHTSPMVGEILEADFGGIRILMALEHEFWTKLEKGRSVFALADSISRYRKNFGLDPMGRRSLQWTIAQTAETIGRVNRQRQRPRVVESTAIELVPSGDDAVELLGALD